MKAYIGLHILRITNKYPLSHKGVVRKSFFQNPWGKKFYKKKTPDKTGVEFNGQTEELTTPISKLKS